MHAFPIYVHHSESDLEEFRKLVERDELIKQYKRHQQKEAKRIVPELDYNEESDEDEYFYCNVVSLAEKTRAKMMRCRKRQSKRKISI